MSRNKSPLAQFVHVERDLADQFGLHVDLLRKVRGNRLKRGTDWDLVKSFVCYNTAGRTQLMAILKISSVLPPGRSPRRLVRAGDGEIEVPDGVALFIGGADSAPNVRAALRTLSTEDLRDLLRQAGEDVPVSFTAKTYVEPKVGEIRTLQCVRTVMNDRIVIAFDGGTEVRVRVKTSKNFRPGMDVPAEFVDGSLWTFVGRLPRWPGKY